MGFGRPAIEHRLPQQALGALAHVAWLGRLERLTGSIAGARVELNTHHVRGAFRVPVSAVAGLHTRRRGRAQEDHRVWDRHVAAIG